MGRRKDRRNSLRGSKKRRATVRGLIQQLMGTTQRRTNFGHWLGSSALASTATTTSSALTFVNKDPRGTCSKLEPPSTRDSHCEEES